MIEIMWSDEDGGTCVGSLLPYLFFRQNGERLIFGGLTGVWIVGL
jgi:hypothetical protein